MNKVSALTLALAIGCAAPAFAAGHQDTAKDTVRDPGSGITLHGPRHDAKAPAGNPEHKLAAEVKAAMHRVATATRQAVHRADNAVHHMGRKKDNT